MRAIGCLPKAAPGRCVTAVVLAASCFLPALPSLAASPVMAESRTPAEATAHALDELANCRAQRRPECPTPAPTSTATPTYTVTPTHTAEPVDPPTPAPTSVPSLPIPSQPIAAYMRPTSHLQTGATLELALPQGRWDVQTDCGDALAAWTDVELLGQVLHGPDDTWLCGIVSSVWVSDAVCATSKAGVCDAEMDGGFWEWLAAQAPTVMPTVDLSPTPTSSPTRRPSTPGVTRVQVQRVVQTVVSVQTVIVLVTPESLVTPTPRPSRTRSPTESATRAPSPSASATTALVVLVTPGPTPEAASGARALVSDANRLWLFGLVFGAAAVGATWFWFTRGRRRYVL